MGCSNYRPSVPIRAVFTAWGSDAPSAWARIDGPLEAVAISAGSQARGVVLGLESGDALVTPDRPWIGRVEGPTSVRPIDSADFTTWSSADNYRLELDTYAVAPAIYPSGRRAPDRVRSSTVVAALAVDVAVLRVWVSGRAGGAIVVSPTGAIDFVLSGVTYYDGVITVYTIGAGSIAANVPTSIPWSVIDGAIDQIRLSVSSTQGATVVIVNESLDG